MQDPALADSEESAPGTDNQRQCDNSGEPGQCHRRLARGDRCLGVRGQAELAHAWNLDLDAVAVEVPGIEVPMAQCQRLAVQALVNGIAGRHAIRLMVLADLNDACERALQLVAGPAPTPARPPAELGVENGFRFGRGYFLWD